MKSNERLKVINLPYRGTFSGIYVVINIRNSRYYIGSSVDVLSRVSAHRQLLRKGTHFNKFLQSDWKKCGEESFFVWFQEAVSAPLLLLREQFWLELGFDKQQRCYNISPEAGRHPHYNRMASHTVIAPNGVEVSFTGIREFCRNTEIRFSSFCEMLNGHAPSAQGWRLPKNRNQAVGQTLPKFYDVKLQDSCGQIHGPFTNLEEFCREHHLRASSIRHLLAGKYLSSKGWKLVNNGISILDKAKKAVKTR